MRVRVVNASTRKRLYMHRSVSEKLEGHFVNFRELNLEIDCANFTQTSRNRKLASALREKSTVYIFYYLL